MRKLAIYLNRNLMDKKDGCVSLAMFKITIDEKASIEYRLCV